MPDETPSQNEQWVACATAYDAMRTLAEQLATALLAMPCKLDGESGRDILSRLTGKMAVEYPVSVNWTDLEPGRDYDADVAQRIALEMLEDAFEAVRQAAR